MKKALSIAMAVLVLILTIVIFVDFNCYKPQPKIINCENNGIILSITAFDGKTESKPFVKCYGHSWISIENKTESSVFLNDCEIKPDEMLTFSVWAISDHCGVVYNLEPQYIYQFDRYDGRRSLSVNVTEDDLKTIGDFIEKNNVWTVNKNCSYWSLCLWNTVVPSEYRLKTQTAVYSPSRIVRSIDEFSNAHTNKDFSNAASVFFFENGVRTELKLCK